MFFYLPSLFTLYRVYRLDEVSSSLLTKLTICHMVRIIALCLILFFRKVLEDRGLNNNRYVLYFVKHVQFNYSHSCPRKFHIFEKKFGF